MAKGNFHKYLINLGFSENEMPISKFEKVFCYSPYAQAPCIKFIVVDSEIEIFNYHRQLWNKNSDNIFLAVGSQKTYLINTKEKPDPNFILKNSICLATFNYGINSKGYNGIDIETISKDNITSAGFYKFIQNRQRKRQEVDKDLLLNLIALRNDLANNENEHIIHLLILRCLFVKYLEDRRIFRVNFLSEVLRSNSSLKLINAFDEICKLNGDVFGSDKLFENDIKSGYLEKLYQFFTSDYQSGQGTLFPYQFDNIPIQLISHVYEAFLRNDTKKGKGIYYTPSFVVNFMLAQSLKKKAEENPNLTILDPAVGSGTFLVESFKILRDSHKKKLNYYEKKRILETQLWGIDTDRDALQITTFSLYLALLEDESPEFIKQEIEYCNPILPRLIGKTLMNANTIVDDILENKKFDFIVSNPPWGSVPSDKNLINISEREAIDNKSGNYPEYKYVADYERSQAFLTRASRWQNADTVTVMIVKNSIFLNNKTKDFRRDFLENNKIDTIFELSHYNKILFKKRVIGKIRGRQPIEIGASEPCAIVIYRSICHDANYIINYISPRLTALGEHFELIQYTSNESFNIDRIALTENDNLWRVLVNGDIEIVKLISKLLNQKDLIVDSHVGFQPSKVAELNGEPLYKKMIEPTCFKQYVLNKRISNFNWNQKVRRRPNIDVFNGRRLVFPVRPLKSDKLLIRGLLLKDEIIHKDNIISIKLNNEKNEPFDLSEAYLGLLNSKLFSFYFYQVSSQWGKGEGKRESIRNIDTQSLPFKKLDEDFLNSTDLLVKEIIEKKADSIDTTRIENILNEKIYTLYNLTEYEKEIIEEFYKVSVDRVEPKLKFVQDKDLIEYFISFKETISLILSPNHTINATFNISANLGAIIKISIITKDKETGIQRDNSLQVLRFVKNRQLSETDKLLKEEKIKLYELQYFYLIKSNQFKDWTKRQAIKDAHEEISLLLSKLPSTHE